ncbi:TATA box-binding protein-associated factor RNA polymerase I subunit A-like [Dendronephthya gigantea]|uniref:TATA box-binding protein-associated factor RNA polymerase I subunit A-like n=1 Tax=Dendronephthya gigantea TaxID=151771 RepID=UPI001069ED45|nr:TATA box-binding protein-associated factor RNA polymerase I subunit A-like [Dendronephthya gigantea]
MATHRFESHCFETLSSFQTVWHPLTQENDTRRMRNIQTRHLYFLSKILQDSLLTHRFTQAIATMIGLSGKCEKVIELFCLAGLEILKSLPHCHMLVLKFYKDMFLACADHQPEIVLNFALYLVLRQRDVVEGLELLKSKSSKQKFNQSLMHKAYIGLFEYLLHQPKKTESTQPQGMETYFSEDEQDFMFPQTLVTKTKLDFSLKRSLVLFEEVFSKPGIWDQFVPIYVELLEMNGERNAVRKFLEQYKNTNPLNPNALRYLYHFLQSNSADDEEKIKVLEDLMKLDPTSEYLEDLFSLKAKSGNEASVIRLIFEKLDHSGCFFDEKAWAHLHSVIGSSLETESAAKHELQLCWEERKSWWPRYHFRLTRNFKFTDELREVMLYKKRVAEYFLGENAFSKEICGKYEVRNDGGKDEETIEKRSSLKRRADISTSYSNLENMKTKRLKQS